MGFHWHNLLLIRNNTINYSPFIYLTSSLSWLSNLGLSLVWIFSNTAKIIEKVIRGTISVSRRKDYWQEWLFLLMAGNVQQNKKDSLFCLYGEEELQNNIQPSCLTDSILSTVSEKTSSNVKIIQVPDTSIQKTIKSLSDGGKW